MSIVKYHALYKRIGTFPLLFLSIVLLFSSCVSQRNVEYLRDSSKELGDIKAFCEANISNYKLKPYGN